MARMLAPINSVKHFVQQSNITVAANAMLNLNLINAVAQDDIVNTPDVTEGSIIKAIYIELWCIGNGATTGITQFNITLEKKPANAPDLTFAQSSTLQAYPNKKNILYTTQGLIGQNVDGQSSVPVLKSWFKIPKGKQRFGLADELQLNIAITLADCRICGVFIYKEYK